MKKLFLLFAFLFFIAIILIYQKNTQDVRSRAQEISFCDDKCKGFDRCDFNSTADNGDPNYNDSCCGDIQRTGDPGACPWPQRGYCTDDQCNAIPEGTNRQRCGGPRHSWCELCRSNNCPGYGTATPTPAAATPTLTPVPTQKALPTNKPSVTATPTPTATSVPQQEPTTIIPFLPTVEPFPTAEPPAAPFKLPEFSLPSFNLPKFNVAELNRNTRKSLSFFEYLFAMIRTYDKKLEDSINKIVPAF